MNRQNKNKYYDKEEERLIKAWELVELPSKIDKKELEKYAKLFADARKKTEQISIRISKQDLLRLKARAAEEGVPYQSLITSIIRKYTKGKLEL